MDSAGSRSDLLRRLSDEMRSREAYDKVFQNIWAASGNLSSTQCIKKLKLLVRFLFKRIV